MRLLKPAWVNHKEGRPIFSIDIHPDGSRFATGGQGDDTGKIIIWNMAPVRDELADKNENVPKILCEMDNHLACVNSVRWSNSGRFLASGGDDKLVMIWHITKYGVGGTVFGSDSKIVESWRPAHTLRGHAGDVLGLAWSPGDVWLATCSIDNTIIVWNAEKFPEQVSVLKGHTGLVKGVTWDPVGKYLASQSDDKSLRIWRTRDWQQESIVTEPFKECGGTTHVLRCDWSPDGHYVVSAHAMNNSGPTAQIVERDGWKTSLDFVGHRKAITVVRFNPGILFKKFKKDAQKPQQYTCCAIGSRDRSLSVWLTALKRPLVVTHDLFTNSVVDISWASNGTELMCCSCDGTVAYVKFKQEEIGTPMGKSDMNRLLEKIYGKTVTKNNTNSSANQIIESADILMLQQQQQKVANSSPEEKSRLASNTSIMSTPSKSQTSFYKGVDVSNSPFKPTDKQIETKTADGRRRITPIFLPVEPDVGEGPVPFTNNSQINFETCKSGTKIQVEKQDKVTHSGLLSPPPQPPGSSPLGKLSGPETTPKSSSSKSPVGENKVIDSVVQPLAALDNKQDQPSGSKLTDTPKSDKHHSSHSHSEKVKTSLSLKRKHDKDEGPKKRGRPRLIDKEKTKSTPSSTPAISTPHHHIGEKETVRYISSTSDLNLRVPSIEKHHTVQVSDGSGDGSFTLEIKNNIQTGSIVLHKLQCIQGGDTVWEQVLSSQILAAAGSRNTSCAACSDCSLSLFNNIGQKILPSIVLNSKISVLHVNGHHIMAISSKGSLYVWNTQKLSCVVKNEQLSSIMKSDEEILKAFVTSDGLPVLTISTNKSYSFNPELACWLMVNDRNDKVHRCSAHYHSNPRVSSTTSGTLTSLQISQERAQGTSRGVIQTGPEIRQLSTLNHLESQLHTCLQLKSATEYKFWLQTYVRYLVQEGIEIRLREVCSDLLGPVYKSKGKNCWQQTVLGFNKRDLLKELLPLFSENLKALQRLYTEFQEQLDIAETG
ncbi:protein HIRA-like [Ruditapes philippinarum]|uniref:protein HIRA-like n=1 Tax=Ruditapes philippinarum TaxID=129788 RepID=UPI00295B11AE|nr:protein HIRA-like [Ruditapes philippinarum]